MNQARAGNCSGSFIYSLGFSQQKTPNLPRVSSATGGAFFSPQKTQKFLRVSAAAGVVVVHFLILKTKREVQVDLRAHE
jgi:hypothetical protein